MSDNKEESGMNDNQLVAVWVKWIAILLIGGTVALVGSCQMTKYRIAEAIKAGADPMEARCAMETNPGQNCLPLYYAPRPKKEPAQ